MAVKSWSPAFLEQLAIAQPEYAAWRLGPAADWDGLFPGTALLLFAAGAALFALAPPRNAAPAAPHTLVRWSKPALPGLLGLALVAAVWGLASPPTALSRVLAQASLAAALAVWLLRLASWPVVQEEADARALVASAAAAAAVLLALVAFGSPIALREGAPPLLDGVFAPLSSVLPPLRELRELKRCLLPAGWFAIVAGALAIERRVQGGARRVQYPCSPRPCWRWPGPSGWAPTRARPASLRLPPAYALLRESRGSGGLLELPFDDWGRIDSVHRMLWQPAHGRPVVAGRTGIEPAWYRARSRGVRRVPFAGVPEAAALVADRHGHGHARGRCAAAATGSSCAPS